MGQTPDLRPQVDFQPEPQPVVEGPVLEDIRESRVNHGRFAVRFEASTNTYGYWGNFEIRFEVSSMREAFEYLPAYARQYLRL